MKTNSNMLFFLFGVGLAFSGRFLEAPPQVQEAVRTRKLILVDEEGNEVARLQTGEDGPQLVFLNEGRERSSLTPSHLSFADEEGKDRTILGLFEDAGMLTLGRPDEGGGIFLSGSPDYTVLAGGVNGAGVSGVQQFSLESREAHASFTLYGPTGYPQIQLGSLPPSERKRREEQKKVFGPFVPALELEVRDQKGVIRFNDPEGEAVLQLPR